MIDVAVVGGGVAGIYAAIAARDRGHRVLGFEAREGLGGTWFANRYPGARCDIESVEYSYGFDRELEQNWHWSERFAGQPEILEYIDHVVAKHDVAPMFQLGTSISSAVFDDRNHHWLLRTSRGDEYSARWLIIATGGHSVAHSPTLPGQGQFEGLIMHSSEWDTRVDVRNKRVAVLGTGPSAIQCVPELAKVAEHVFVLQRTPNFVVPANNGEIDPAFEERVKSDYADFRQRCTSSSVGIGAEYRPSCGHSSQHTEAQRVEEFGRRWDSGGFTFVYSYDDMGSSRDLAESAGRFIRSKIRDAVSDPDIAELLSPEHVFGARRLCVGTDYYESFNLPNVELVDLRSTPILEITRSGIDLAESISLIDARDGMVPSVDAERRHLDVDLIVLATGFESQTSALQKIDIEGPNGSLQELWRDRPWSYLGLMTAGMPNLFLVNGPGNPSITTNMITNAERSVDLILDCISTSLRSGATKVQVTDEAQAKWTALVDDRAKGLLIFLDKSRYVSRTPQGQPYVLPYIGMGDYLETIEAVAASGFPGFTFSSSPSHSTTSKESTP